VVHNQTVGFTADFASLFTTATGCSDTCENKQDELFHFDSFVRLGKVRLVLQRAAVAMWCGSPGITTRANLAMQPT
jgi:hypothetical protein